MANKTTTVRTETTYQFDLSHGDVVDMMNDPQVLIESGDVSDDQILTMYLKKSGGGEVLLKDFTETDTLIFRYTKVTIEDETAALGNIDVESP